MKLTKALTPEQEKRFKKVRDYRSSRLNKPPYQKFRQLYRLIEEWFEHSPDERSKAKKMVADIENKLASEIELADQRGYNKGRTKCLEQHGMKKTVDEAKREAVKEERERIVEIMSGVEEVAQDEERAGFCDHCSCLRYAIDLIINPDADRMLVASKKA